MKFIWVLFSFCCLLTFGKTQLSYFDCKSSAGGYRPFYIQWIEAENQFKDWSKTSQGLLGQKPMTTLGECKRAVETANTEFGVICSRTGLNGWKPTLYTGTLPGRPDFGYLGGSSIVRFEDCLEATQNSSGRGVCFWGGSDWWISPIDKEGVVGGPFDSLTECVQKTSTWE